MPDSAPLNACTPSARKLVCRDDKPPGDRPPPRPVARHRYGVDAGSSRRFSSRSTASLGRGNGRGRNRDFSLHRPLGYQSGGYRGLRLLQRAGIDFGHSHRSDVDSDLDRSCAPTGFPVRQSKSLGSLTWTQRGGRDRRRSPRFLALPVSRHPFAADSHARADRRFGHARKFSVLECSPGLCENDALPGRIDVQRGSIGRDLRSRARTRRIPPRATRLRYLDASHSSQPEPVASAHPGARRSPRSDYDGTFFARSLMSDSNAQS